MNVWFCTSRHGQDKVLKLCEFVEALVSPPGKCHLLVGDRDRSKELTTGLTQLAQDSDVVEVFVWVSRGAAYPRKTRHVKEVKTVTLNSWEEEFVLVLAHELRHVHHFTTLLGTMNSYEQEVDAEMCAIEVLDQFRASRSRSSRNAKRFATDRA